MLRLSGYGAISAGKADKPSRRESGGLNVLFREYLEKGSKTKKAL